MNAIPPRIWLFTDSPWAGGAERYLEYLLAAEETGTVGILAVERPGLVSWLKDREDERIPVRRIGAASRIMELRNLYRELKVLQDESSMEVLHFNLPGPYEAMLGMGPAVARAAGVQRIIVTEHLPGVGRVGKRWFIKRLALRVVDAAICVCEAHRHEMQHLGYGAQQIQPIQNGIPDPNPDGRIAAANPGRLPDDLSAYFPGSDPLIIQVGSLESRKGAATLIRAIQGIPARLLLVGQGPQESELRALVGSLGLQGQIHFAGSRDDVPELLGAASVAVLASEREGLPLSLLEAAAMGLPIVSTDVDGIPEVVIEGKTGRLIAPGDVPSLREALQELLSNPDRRGEWGRAARAHYLSHFSLEQMQQRTREVWKGKLG